MFLLTSCETVPSASMESARLYQPRVLRLAPGLPVQTLDGIHVPQVAETWHSDAAFHTVEQQVLDLSAALAQERARN